MTTLLNDGYPFTSLQARDLGIRAPALRGLLREGRVRREYRDVYVDAHVPDSRSSRLRAIVLVTPDNAVVCDESAAWLYGLDVHAPGRRHALEPSLLVRHSHTRVERPGSRGRQALLHADDVTYVGGVHVTTPLRTTSDLLRRMYRPYALAAADAFAHAGLVDVDELVAYVARLKGYRGIVQARSLATLVEPRTQSPGESWQRLRMRDAGFPPPEPQFEVVDHHGRSYFLDLPYPDLLIASEYDGREFHLDERDVAHDAGRRSYLTELFGWRWVIGTRPRLFGTDTGFEDELGALLGIPPLQRWWGTRPQPATPELSPAVRNRLVS
jgi:hypothetical protein